MILHAVTCLALAGLVRASVIINVFEDGEVKASHSLRGGCNFRACDQLCRRLGFKSGVCVGDRCKCDNFAPLNEAKADYSLLGSCNYQASNQLCRRLGFPGGACVGDRCKCDNFKPIKVTGELLDYLLKSNRGNKAAHSYDDCNFQACDQFCRNLGFPGGACDGDRCDCDNFKGESHRSQAATLPGACDIVKCNDMCHRMNYIGGMCVNGSCQCY